MTVSAHHTCILVLCQSQDQSTTMQQSSQSGRLADSKIGWGNSVHSLLLVTYFSLWVSYSNQAFMIEGLISFLSLLLISLLFVEEFLRNSLISQCGTKPVGGVTPYIATNQCTSNCRGILCFKMELLQLRHLHGSCHVGNNKARVAAASLVSYYQFLAQGFFSLYGLSARAHCSSCVLAYG